MTSVSRTTRLANEIKRALAENLHTEIKDPRLSPMAAITRVELTRDLRYSKVYVSVYDKPEAAEESIAVLNSAAGYIKSIIARNVDIRTVPSLKFILDDSAEYSAHISKLLDEAMSHDRD